MKLKKRIFFLVPAIVALTLLASGSVFAHSFDVALIVPQLDPSSGESRDVVQGFLLATTERDAHPNQESDGHLGGLDVYVTVVDGRGDIVNDISTNAPQGKVDLVVAFGSEALLSRVSELLKEHNVVLLLPGQSPFSEEDQPAVVSFVSAYEGAYGERPSLHAAQGYNAARRIDFAVREQGGVDDRTSLRRNFAETAQGFSW